jgi:hypothetical protein
MLNAMATRHSRLGTAGRRLALTHDYEYCKYDKFFCTARLSIMSFTWVVPYATLLGHRRRSPF